MKYGIIRLIGASIETDASENVYGRQSSISMQYIPHLYRASVKTKNNLVILISSRTLTLLSPTASLTSSC